MVQLEDMASRFDALNANPLIRDELGNRYWRQIPALDLGELTLRPLVEAATTAEIKPRDGGEIIEITRGGGFITDLPGDLDPVIKAAAADIVALADGLPELRRQSTRIRLHPANHQANTKPHADNTGFTKVVSAYPGNTQFLKPDWQYPVAEGQVVIPPGGDIAQATAESINPEDWWTIEEHALIFNTNYSIHRKPELNQPQYKGKLRAVLEMTLLPVSTPLTWREQQLANRGEL